MTKPVLVTITAPSCAGKSFLFDYIRDIAKLPCLISTTTRAPRANEVHGRDYYFITAEESVELEKSGQLAELAIYNGTRYGVTKSEFHNKLSNGLAFMIVEPSGIEHYAQPAIDVGAHHYKVWLDVRQDVRLKRFQYRAELDIVKAASNQYASFVNAIHTVLKRQQSMLTEELTWYAMANWDCQLNGADTPETNLGIILEELALLKLR